MLWGGFAILGNIIPMMGQIVLQPKGIPLQQEPSAMLQINSLTNINGPYTGFLPPRMDSVQRKAIGSPANGLLVYDTDLNTFMQFKQLLSRWDSVSTTVTPFWNPTGNNGLGAGNFLGTGTNSSFRMRVNNQQVLHLAPNQLVVGREAGSLSSISPGDENFSIAIGLEALFGGAGSNNIAIGFRSLRNTTDAFYNIYVGSLSGEKNINTKRNIAIGREALYSASNNEADENIAVGYRAMAGFVEGNGNVGIGKETLRGATAFPVNHSGTVAIGDSILYNLVLTPYGTIMGSGAARPGDAALFNTGLGYGTLGGRGAYYNTAAGAFSLAGQNRGITGGSSVALGHNALRLHSIGVQNVAIGAGSLQLEAEFNQHVAIGYRAGNNASADGAVAIGIETLENNSGKMNVHVGNHLFSNAINMDTTVVMGTAIGNSSTEELNNAVLIGANILRSSGLPQQNVVGIGYNSFGISNGGANIIQMGIGGLSSHSTGSNLIALGANATGSSGSISNAAMLGTDSKVFASESIALGGESTGRWLFGRNSNDAGRCFTVGSTTGNGNGAYLTNGGSWVDVSDSATKSDIRDVDMAALIAAIKQLPIQQWRYKGTNEYHIGAMAQDFHYLLKVGANNTALSHLDVNSVALLLIGYLRNEQTNMLKELDALEAKQLKNKSK